MERVDERRYQQLIEALEKVLRGAGWSVESEVKLGPLRPDLLLRSPKGHTYITELKVGGKSEHFASVATVSNWRKLLLKLSESGLLATVATVPVPLILTASAIAPAVIAMAKNLDVELLKINGDDAESSAQTALRRLQELDEHRTQQAP